MRGMRLFREARRLVDYGERYYCNKTKSLKSRERGELKLKR